MVIRLVALLLGLLCFSSITQTISAHSISKLDKRASTPQPGVLECVVAPADSFNDKAGNRHQLVAVGPTNPIGTVQTFQNTHLQDHPTFRLAISAISRQAMEIHLVNFKTGYAGAPPNSASQTSRYRVILFDKNGFGHETILWLAGYQTCRYTLKNPVNIDDNFVVNIVVLNTV